MSDTATLTPVSDLFGAPFRRRFKNVGPLPVSGHVVRIRSLTEAELSKHRAGSYVGEDLKVAKAKIEDANRRFLALCLCDGDGNRLVAPADAGKFAEWDGADTDFLYSECRGHVYLKREPENGEKNSDATADA